MVFKLAVSADMALEVASCLCLLPYPIIPVVFLSNDRSSHCSLIARKASSISGLNILTRFSKCSLLWCGIQSTSGQGMFFRF